MCLAVPGKVEETFLVQGLRMAKLRFEGVLRDACLEYVPQAQIGDYVLVHVGFALSVVDEEEANRTFQLLAELEGLAEEDERQKEQKLLQKKKDGA